MSRQPFRYLATVFGVAVLLAVVFLSFACETIQLQSTASPLIGQLAPDFELKTVTGELASLGDLMGSKATLIDFWATWCAPCIAELPHLQALANKYRHKGLSVVGVVCDTNVEEVAPPFVKAQGLTYTNLLGDAEIQSDYGVTVFPTLVLIDAEGKVLRQSSGALRPERLVQWAEEALGIVEPGSPS